MKLAPLKKKVAALRERVGDLQTVAYDSVSKTKGKEAAFWDFAEGQLNDAYSALSNLEEEIIAREKDPSRSAPQ